MGFDPQKHHRRSIRLPGYDYSQAGAYFITLVTHERACLFGEIVDGEVRLSDFGLVADECWRLIPEHFPAVELGAYVVMPNHVHGIIILHDRNRRGTPWRAPTHIEKFGKPVSGSLATIVRQYKSSVTRIISQRYGGVSNIWQRNYYEHIIRSDDEHARIHLYIESNPAKWKDDDQNPEK